MKEFLASSSGRILFVAFAVALGGTGVGKLMGPAGLAIGAIAVFASFAITVVALATAVNDHFGPAVLMVLTLPWLAFLGEIGQGLLPAIGGYALVAAGLAAAAFALRPPPDYAQRATELEPARTH